MSAEEHSTYDAGEDARLMAREDREWWARNREIPEWYGEGGPPPHPHISLMGKGWSLIGGDWCVFCGGEVLLKWGREFVWQDCRCGDCGSKVPLPSYFTQRGWSVVA